MFNDYETTSPKRQRTSLRITKTFKNNIPTDGSEPNNNELPKSTINIK